MCVCVCVCVCAFVCARVLVIFKLKYLSNTIPYLVYDILELLR